MSHPPHTPRAAPRSAPSEWPSCRLRDCEATAEFNLDRIATESFVAGIVFRRTIDSTNTRALEWAGACRGPTPLLVLAERQTAGRGRGTNRWWSDTGALTFSLVLDAVALGVRPDQWPRISLAAAVAVCEAIEQTAPQVPTGIRWPNDVDLAARKVCGILPELPALDATHASPRLVLGIGVNLNNSLRSAPAEIQSVGTSLHDVTGGRHDPTEFLVQLLGRLARTIDLLARQDPALPAAWSRRCLLAGRRIAMDLESDRVRGVCRGIDRDGALVLDSDAGPRRFLSGRVTIEA